MPWTKPYQPARNQHLDPSLYAVANQPCFITIRAWRDSAPFVSPLLNRMVIDALLHYSLRNGCRLLAYCLMPDHLHYLVTPLRDGQSPLSFTNQFKGSTTNDSWKIGWQGKLWQPRHYDHLVRADEDLMQIVDYVLQNPIRKGLTDESTLWPWCWRSENLLV